MLCPDTNTTTSVIINVVRNTGYKRIILFLKKSTLEFLNTDGPTKNPHKQKNTTKELPANSKGL